MFEKIKKIFRKKAKPIKINKEDKRAYVLKKEHGTDISFENETKKLYNFENDRIFYTIKNGDD